MLRPFLSVKDFAPTFNESDCPPTQFTVTRGSVRDSYKISH